MSRFLKRWTWTKSILVSPISIANLKTLIYIFLYKTLLVSIICDKCGIKEETSKEEESIEILKSLDLIDTFIINLKKMRLKKT